MTLPPEFDQPAGRGLRRIDSAIGRGQARVFRVLWFMVPPGSVAWNVNFQALLVSRFLSDIALQALLYGVLIATAREGGRAIDAALVGTAYLLPGVILGMFGGAVADALPKRVALAGAYLVMGVLCFLILGLLGTRFFALLAVLFAVRVLHQVSQPSEASAVPLVATDEELASANSFLSLGSSVGEVLGKAVLAPLIVVAYGVDVVIGLAGALFVFSSTRVLHLQHREVVYLDQEAPRPSVRLAVAWLVAEPAALWMLMLAGMAATANVVLGVLAPQYTGEVLGVDPSRALYVFAPAAGGLVLALLLAPAGIRIFGERPVAIAGFTMAAVSMAGLAIVTELAGVLGWLLIVDVPGVGRELEMAGLLSVPLGAGITLAAAATQTYVGRHVPSRIHGRVFALLGVMKDGLAIPPLLGLGAVAAVVGVRWVMLFAPFMLLALALAIERAAARWRPPAT